MSTIKRDENSNKIMRVKRGTSRRAAREQQGYVGLQIGPVTHQIWARGHAHAQAKFNANPTRYQANA